MLISSQDPLKGTLANSVDPDQLLQDTASNQGPQDIQEIL